MWFCFPPNQISCWSLGPLCCCLTPGDGDGVMERLNQYKVDQEGEVWNRAGRNLTRARCLESEAEWLDLQQQQPPHPKKGDNFCGFKEENKEFLLLSTPRYSEQIVVFLTLEACYYFNSLSTLLGRTSPQLLVRGPKQCCRQAPDQVLQMVRASPDAGMFATTTVFSTLFLAPAYKDYSLLLYNTYRNQELLFVLFFWYEAKGGCAVLASQLILEDTFTMLQEI